MRTEGFPLEEPRPFFYLIPLFNLLELIFPHFTRGILKGRRLFFRSEPPGLVFSVTYLRGKLVPSAVLPLLWSGSQGFPHR